MTRQLICSAYPERILVYHAGLGKIVTVSSIKLTTVFFSILGCFFATNVIINMPDQPVWQGPASTPLPTPFWNLLPGADHLPPVFAGGAVPLLTVGFLTSPFVAMVHMRIPPSVRPRSRALVARWAESLPRSTELHFTTVGLIGMRHTYRSLYAPLRRKEPAPFWNISNLVVTGVARGSATGWVPRIRRQQGQFFVGIQYQRGSEAQIWKQAWGKIPWL